MKFIIDNHPECEVIRANSFLSLGGIQVNWGITEFGFGEFVYYTKDEKLHCSNETCGPATVTAVLKKAFWDMIYSNFERLEFTDKNFTLKQATAQFAVSDRGFRIFRTSHKNVKINGKIHLSFFEESNFVEYCLVFDEKIFPQHEEMFALSDFIEAGQWGELFVSAVERTWTKVNHAEMKTSSQPEVMKASFQKENDKQLKLLWESTDEKGFFIIENDTDVSANRIYTFGKDREFVLKVIQKLTENIVLID